MLPYQKQKEAAVVTPVDHVKRKPDEDAEYDPMHAAADDLISAVHAKDTQGVAEALRAAFDLADSEPHVEGPHIGE